jgi:POT family proton-dependent oligopeptide transporter
MFDQTNSTWVLQGYKMMPVKIFGWNFGAEEMQSMNPLLVMILVPVMTWGIYPLVGRLASPLRRMSSGMFLGAASFLVVAWIQRQIDAGHQLSIMWQTLPYVILTVAEVLVSTTGLEFAFREAAPEMKSLIMSFFLLTISVGDFLVAVVTKALSTAGNESGSISAGRFVLYAEITFVVAILFSIATMFYQYRDKSAAEGK